MKRFVRSYRWNWRTWTVFYHDVLAAAAAWLLAHLLRFNFENAIEVATAASPLLFWLLPVQALIFWGAGLYRGIWRFASLHDLRRILVAVALATAVVPIMAFLTRSNLLIPRSVLVLFPMLLGGFMSGSRLAYRMWREHSLARFTLDRGEPVMVIGAGDAGANLIKELAKSPRWRAVALLDDNPAKQGRVVYGVRVAGTSSEVVHWAEAYGAATVILAMPSAPHHARRRIVERCTAAGLEVLTVPSFEELIAGGIGVERLRKIELEDLLGRDPVALDAAGLRRFLSSRVVMVTGAGGSIGSELCRQISRFEPGLLLLFELNEFALYRLQEEFRRRYPKLPIVAIVGDVKNPARVERVLAEYRPAVIFHAAAYKHVPLMEETNAWEALRNNVLGTYVLGSAAIRSEVEKLVLISTDKAVNPTNVMGASKRLAEMVCQALSHKGGTLFEMVRFGNVLGSSGSVIPKFQEQIAHGGPITVTHPEIIRYFMSIPEATQLVLQAGCMGQGGEIFVLDMGQPVKIVDLARDMIRLSGVSEEDVRIEFTGLRPGEKLYEELLADGEQTLPTHHPKVRIARAREVEMAWLGDLLEWLRQEKWPSDDAVRRDLRKWVPEYAPSSRPELRKVAG